MHFEPVDEMSLRHLFSSKLGEESLPFAYIGPVLDSAGIIQTSPDCLILDLRRSPYRPLRCEFKFKPNGAADFAHNGFFDIAVIWSLPASVSKKRLEEDLLAKNRCTELLILSEHQVFSRLPPYNFDSCQSMNQIGTVTDLCLNRDKAAVVLAYIAAVAYPKAFDNEKLTDFLRKKFAHVEKMAPRGRGNIAGAWLQTHPPLIVRLHQSTYLWNDSIDSTIAQNELTDFIVNRLRIRLPQLADFQHVIVD
jgi:hypothetical protein